MIWDTSRTGPMGDLCAIPECHLPPVVKNLCNKHYQSVRLGRIDPETGKYFSDLKREQRQAVIAANKEQLAKRLEEQKTKLGPGEEMVGYTNDDKYVFIETETAIINRDSGVKMSVHAASCAWGKDIYEKIQTHAIRHCVSCCFVPRGDEFIGPHYNVFKETDAMRGEDTREPLLFENERLLKGLGQDNYQYLVDWLSWNVNNYQDVTVALVIHGIQGSGKGLLAKLLGQIFGQYQFHVDAGTLQNEFNFWLENKFLIIADEITTGSMRERELTMNRLKSWVVPGTVHINKKGKDQYQIETHASWLFYSNDKHPVDIEPEDRRFSVIKTDRKLHPDVGREIADNKAKYAKNLRNWLKWQYVNREDFHPQRPLENDDRDKIRSTIQRVVVPIR